MCINIEDHVQLEVVTGTPLHCGASSLQGVKTKKIGRAGALGVSGGLGEGLGGATLQKGGGGLELELWTKK